MDVLIDKYIIGLYQNLEDEVIADIARRVKKTGRYTETAELMAKSMVEQGYSAEKIQAEVMKMLRANKQLQMEIAENTKAYKQEIQDIIKQTVKEAKEAGNRAVAEAGNMAWNNDLSMWREHGTDLKKPNTMSQMIEAFQKQTNNELRNLTRTTGFKNTVFGTTGVLNAYQREMDLALLKVSTGTFSYDQVVNDCIHRLAQSGLRSIDYANGRTYQLDTAVRMSVRTGMSQLAGRVMEENLKNSGQDLVITSQHMGSRPEHAPWQNKVFSYSGKSKKYPDFFKETGYGTAAGLKGVNCTHDFYPFWEGASVIPDDIVEPDPVTVNGREYTYYQATQQQRKMERAIRATKREIEAQKAIGGDTKELQAQLRRQTADYHRFSKDAGIRAKDNRLRLEKGTSNLSKNSQNKINKSVRNNAQRIVDVDNEDKNSKIEIDESIIFRNAEKDDYSRLYKKHSKNIEKEDIEQIKNHKKADGSSGGYVATTNYITINSNMRNDGFVGNKLDPDDLCTINSLRNAISRNTLDDDYYLTRYVNADYLTSVFGVKFNPFGKGEETINNSIVKAANFKKFIPKITEELQSFVGQTITEKAFVSTSLLDDKNIMQNKPVMLLIEAPKGTNCYIPKNRKESECILGDNTSLYIRSIEFNPTDNKWIVNARYLGEK